jgi:hypothetical protein
MSVNNEKNEDSVTENPRPWTNIQKVVSTLVISSVAIAGCSWHIFLNHETFLMINPPRGGANANSVYAVASIAFLVFSATVALSLKRWHSDFHTLKDGLSVRSVPYQSLLGLLAVIYIISWIARMQSTTLVDLSHCNYVTTTKIPITVYRIQNPTSINWTAVEFCTVDQIGKDDDIKPEFGVKQPPTWYSYADDDRRISWAQHLLDMSITLIFGLNLVLVGVLHVVEGILGGNDQSFSWLAPFCNWMTVIDCIVVFGSFGSIITDTFVYDLYGVAGCFRFLLLEHPSQCLEFYLEKRKKEKRFGAISRFLAICVAVNKLLFVCLLGAGLIFMAEAPCEVVLSDYRNREGSCDASFQNFGSVVYFTFVTLSTVGFGDISPKTPLGQALIIFIILFGISYLPGAISNILHMYLNNDDDDNHKLLQKVLKSLYGLRKADSLLMEIAKDKKSQQVGYFHNGGTSLNSVNRLPNEASMDILKLFIERAKKDSIDRENDVDERLFQRACVRLEETHGEDKISDCLRLLELNENGGSSLLVEHVLGLTVRCDSFPRAENFKHLEVEKQKQRENEEEEKEK